MDEWRISHSFSTACVLCTKLLDLNYEDNWFPCTYPALLETTAIFAVHNPLLTYYFLHTSLWGWRATCKTAYLSLSSSSSTNRFLQPGYTNLPHTSTLLKKLDRIQSSVLLVSCEAWEGKTLKCSGISFFAISYILQSVTSVVGVQTS